MLLFAFNIFLSAFLLFQIQPIIGRFVLPWFGGTPAVWSTLMLVFQILLTGGYAYATWLSSRARRPVQVHIVLVLSAVVLLAGRGMTDASPVMASVLEISRNGSSPVLEIIKLLSVSIALPFFVLASNSPLMQVWFSRKYPDRSYARLYGLSNLGSLLGLLTYPFLIEPNFSLRIQGWLWSAGFLLFGLLSGVIALKSGWAASLSKRVDAPLKPRKRPPPALMTMWIALSATASLFLLSVTNQISQEVAVIPFLWILPLSIYLLSFILAFSSEWGYHRKFYASLFLISSALTLFVMLNATRLHVYWQILAYCLLLFASCMLCHGELYLLRPAAENLTLFYLMVSVGGAIGGIFVSLVAPVIFNGYWEFFVGLAMTVAVLLTILRSGRDATARARFVITVFALVTVMLVVLGTYFSDSIFSQRNFYGVIRVRETLVGNPPQRAYLMSHGITVHGMQFIDALPGGNIPTTYYVPKSGVGLAILNHPKYGHQQRVGLLGLGVGTLLAYSQPGDVYRLYEINPAVNRLASGTGDYFSYLSDSKADITIVAGDARISLQRELAEGHRQDFDVLVLDAFSSDSVPVHLLTKEAFEVYLEHLAPDGIIAAHITNLHLDLQTVLWQLARHYGLSMVRVSYAGDSEGGYASEWILLARDRSLLETPAIREHTVDMSGYSTHIRLWTDDYSNLFQLLK